MSVAENKGTTNIYFAGVIEPKTISVAESHKCVVHHLLVMSVSWHNKNTNKLNQWVSLWWRTRSHDFFCLLRQATAQNQQWLNMNHINPFPKTNPTNPHRVPTDHTASLWLSVSGPHFHNICMILFIGWVWKHFEGPQWWGRRGEHGKMTASQVRVRDRIRVSRLGAKVRVNFHLGVRRAEG